MKKIPSFTLKTIIRIILIAFFIMIVVPLLWTVMQSFKTSQEFFADPWALPAAFEFTNYVNAWNKANMSTYFFNSVFVTILSSVLLMALSIPISYCLARFKFRFSGLIFILITLGLFIQPSYILVPLFVMLNNWNLLNSLIMLSLIYAVIQLPFAVLILTGFIQGVSRDYEEVAEVEGCNRVQTITKVVLPLIRPGIITVLIFNFMGFWNEYPMAFTFLSEDSKRTLPVGLQNLMEVQRFSTDWGALFAGMVIIMVPTIVIYTILNKKLTDGVGQGGLKG